jgi:hypothetical protein
LSSRKKDSINYYIDKIHNLDWEAGSINFNDSKLLKQIKEELMNLHNPNISPDQIKQNIENIIWKFIEEPERKRLSKLLTTYDQAFAFMAGELDEKGNVIREEITDSVLKGHHIFEYLDTLVAPEITDDNEIRNAILDENNDDSRYDDFMQFNESDINDWIEYYIHRKNVIIKLDYLK